MSSLVSGTSILHIANRLGDMRKETGLEEMDMPSTPPVSESVPEAEPSLKFRIFKDVLKNTYSTVPTSNSTTPSTSSVEEQQQFTPPEPIRQEECPPTAPPAAFDLIQAISQMQKDPNSANTSMFGTPPPPDQQNQSLQNFDGMLTMRDLLPGYSPWLRNAGRKKSHPVWDFFKDLKDTNGIGRVICLHCSWSGDDRSPNNLRTHLKKFHTSDGIFAKFSQKLAQTPTQPYVKRARAGGINHQTSSNATDTMALALQQLQNASNLNTMNGALNLNGALNFLENMPKSSEVINISAGFGGVKEDDEEQQQQQLEMGNEPGSSGASANGERAVSGSPVEENAGGSPSVSSTNQLNAFMNMAANPLMWNALVANTSHGSAFSLNDGQCVSVLMKMAIDLDLTMSYHKRRGDIELCFESNRTAEKSGGRGKVLCLCDMSREIRVIERVNGAPTDTEMWTKTDFNQFHWAIRGKCQKVLVKN